jgi:hypothetical protein
MLSSDDPGSAASGSDHKVQAVITLPRPPVDTVVLQCENPLSTASADFQDKE